MTPAQEGFFTNLVQKMENRKYTNAQVEVLANNLASMKPESAITKWVKAGNPYLTKDPAAVNQVRAWAEESKKDDNDSQKTYVKTFSGYTIAYVVSDGSLALMVVPCMTKKGKPSSDAVLPRTMAATIINPPQAPSTSEE